MKSLLDEAGVNPNAYDIILHAADGYTDSIPVERAMAGDVLIAYKMNGATLPPGHGYPARIIVPGVYGMKQVQWLTAIELVNKDYLGYHQRQGWSDDAIVQTRSWITDPQEGDGLAREPITLRGFAFAGDRGIRSVDISLDDGETWKSAVLEPTISPYAWRFWHYTWHDPKPGDYRLRVRATDGTGVLQSSIEQKPFPNGGTGLQEISFSVAA